MYSYGPLHMAEQKQGDQLKPTYSSSDMGCSPEDLAEAMNDREGWRERVRDICADGTTRRDDDIYIYYLIFIPIL